MRNLRIISGIGLAGVLLASCTPAVPPVEPSIDGAAMSSSSTAPSASVEGLLQRAGISIYMEGTHRLQMDDGSFLLLRSDTIGLDSYSDTRVIVTGPIMPTVEGEGVIMSVEDIEGVTSSLPPEVLTEETSSSSVLSEETLPPVVVESSSSVSQAPLPLSSSSAAPIVPTSSSSSASPQSVSADASVSVKAMAKAVVDAANFREKYCTSYIGFCVPYHRNWYFQSFGPNVSPYLWHVEFADHSVDEAGQGVIIFNLVQGPLGGPDGAVTEQGDFVVASRQWTGNRHMEISAPKELRAAVEFMASGIEVYETPSAQ